VFIKEDGSAIKIDKENAEIVIEFKKIE